MIVRQQARDTRVGLPPMQSFRDVLAGPAPDRDTPAVLWPNFDEQIHARLWRRNKRVCTALKIDDRRPVVLREPAVFVSMYDNHFGHFVSETVPRIPQSLFDAPGLPLYFTSAREMDIGQTSGMFRSVIDWLGISHDRVRFVSQPTLFRDLQVAAQAEHLDGPTLADGYLDLLEARISGKVKMVRPTGITFVTRAGLGLERGRHAGEGYLAACLQELGVQVMHPERLPLGEQMQIYAQSRHLVFSEGSAAHGRQLLGRVDQSISILRRRYRHNLGMHQLSPRCASLSYVSCFGGSLNITDFTGRKLLYAMTTLYQINDVLEHFEGLGIPLSRAWNDTQYRKARDKDIIGWVESLYNPGVQEWMRPHNTEDYLLDQFDELGLSHLRSEVQTIIRARDGSEHGGAERTRQPVASAYSPLTDERPVVLPLNGERGIDLFTRSLDAPNGREQYWCFASSVGQGAESRLHFFDKVEGVDAVAAARAVREVENSPAISEFFPFIDPSKWPRASNLADPIEMFLYVDLFRAWQISDIAVQSALQRLENSLDETLAQLNALPDLVSPFYSFNRLSLAQRAARIIQPALDELLATGELKVAASNHAGYAMRMLGDLAARAEDHSLALACFETSIVVGGDNQHRRRLAIVAANSAGNLEAEIRHLSAFRTRWPLPPELERISKT